MQIKTEFYSSLLEFTSKDLIEKLWNEIETAYSSHQRHYHTVSHLENLIETLIPYRSEFKRWDVVVLAIVYHDAVYEVLKWDNEEKSARLAKERLSSTSFPSDQINYCCQLILATKKHEASDYEVNLFTDADLNILGADQLVYTAYAANIRKEYSIFPALVYNPGRKKVLKHFIEMPRIFKTDEFYKLFEDQARKNLEWELSVLKNNSEL